MNWKRCINKKFKHTEPKKLLCWDSIQGIELSKLCTSPDMLTWLCLWFQLVAWLYHKVTPGTLNYSHGLKAPATCCHPWQGTGGGGDIWSGCGQGYWAMGSLLQLHDPAPILPRSRKLWIFQWLPRGTRWHTLGIQKRCAPQDKFWPMKDRRLERVCRQILIPHPLPVPHSYLLAVVICRNLK